MPPEPSAIAVLGWASRAKLVAAGSYHGAGVDYLAANRAPAQADRILKADVAAGSTPDFDLGPHGGISISAWLDVARTANALYRIMSDNAFVRASLRTRVVVPTVAGSASVVGEGDPVPVAAVEVQSVVLQPIRVSTIFPVTNELLSDVSANGQSFFNRLLMSRISAAVDRAFVAAIISTDTPSAPSSGVSATNAWADLRAALLQVSTAGPELARPYALAAPDVAVRAAALATADGAQVFVAASPSGGEIANVPLLVSSGVPDGSLVIIDAAGIAVDAAAPTTEASQHADLLMRTDPTMPAQMTSMWQSNSTALKANAIFGAEILRPDAVAVVTGITWGG